MTPPTNLLLLLGRSGAGKDEQASRMRQLIPNVGVISPGLSLRQLRTGNSRYDNFQQRDEILRSLSLMDKGKLLPGHLMVSLTKFEVEKELEDGKRTIVVTGLPSSLDQLREFDMWMSTARGTLLPIYVQYDASQGTAEERLKGRIDEGRRRGIVRSDDENEEARRTRQGIYEEHIVPVLDELKRRGVLHRISANGSREQVYDLTRELLVSLSLIPTETETWQRSMAFRR